MWWAVWIDDAVVLSQASEQHSTANEVLRTAAGEKEREQEGENDYEHGVAGHDFLALIAAAGGVIPLT